MRSNRGGESGDGAAPRPLAGDLPADLSGTVGVTAGASAPDELVDAVVRRLAPVDGMEEISVTDEDEYFPPPRELRELMATLDVAAPVLLGGAAPATATAAGGAFTDDRRVDASDVLAG